MWYQNRIFDLIAKVNFGANAFARVGNERVPVELPNAVPFQQELAAMLGAPGPVEGNGPVTINYEQPAAVPSELEEDTETAAALTLNATNENTEGASTAVALRIKRGVADIPGICPIGTILPLTIATTAQGWALADGVANSVANGGSGLNAMLKYLKFNSPAGEWGSSGATGSGTASITVSAPNTTTSGSTAPGVSVTVNSGTTGITIANHTDLEHTATATSGLSHAGSGNTNTSDHTAAVTVDDNADGTTTTASGTHHHEVDVSVVASLFNNHSCTDVVACIANHTISAHSVTDTGHTHTGSGTVDSHTHNINHSHTATDAGHTHGIGTLQLDRIELIPYERIA